MTWWKASEWLLLWIICNDMPRRVTISSIALLLVTKRGYWITRRNQNSRVVWKHPQSPVRKKFRTAPAVHKVMLAAFWDCRGPLVLDFMPRGATINADRDCSTLSLLRTAIRKKRRIILDVDVIILHDNARPHVANKTVNKLRKFHWEFLEHPPYSLDLAPNDFHLFSPLCQSGSVVRRPTSTAAASQN